MPGSQPHFAHWDLPLSKPTVGLHSKGTCSAQLLAACSQNSVFLLDHAVIFPLPTMQMTTRSRQRLVVHPTSSCVPDSCLRQPSQTAAFKGQPCFAVLAHSLCHPSTSDHLDCHHMLWNSLSQMSYVKLVGEREPNVQRAGGGESRWWPFQCIQPDCIGKG